MRRKSPENCRSSGKMTAAAASITAAAPQTAEPATDADLAFAKAAAVDLMGRGAVDSSQPWENPRTGARGTVTPIAASYTREGATCRDFLASYLRGTQEAWYQGGVCRNGKKWEVRGIRPLQRT